MSYLVETEYEYRIIPDRYRDGTPCFYAFYPDLPGCGINADSEAEAKQLLPKALKAYLGVLNMQGLHAPAPEQKIPSANPETELLSPSAIRGLWRFQTATGSHLAVT